jgi:hypothetical protein
MKNKHVLLAMSLVSVLLAAPPLFALESASEPEVIYPEYSAETPPLSEMAKRPEALLVPKGPPAELNKYNTIIPDRLLQEAPFLPLRGGDPALQQDFFSAPKINAPLRLNFLGLGKGFPGFVMTGEPPDTEGAVGATQYVQWVNSMYAVFNKANGAKLAGPFNGNLLFSVLPATSICRTTNSGDPIAQYDKFANRWVLTQFAIKTNSGPYAQCIAVSKTRNAAGAYFVYQVNFPDFPDYPKLGVWPDGYYITFNMFSHTTGSFLNAKTCAFERAKMLVGLTPRIVCFNPPNTLAASLLPGDLDGKTLPPAGAPNPQFELFNTTKIARWSFHVNYAKPALSTYTGVLVPVKPFNFVCNNFAGNTDTCVTQKSTTQKLDTLGDRMMYRVAYRNLGGIQRVVLSHSVDAGGGRTGVRWYEIRNPNAARPTVFQQSTFAPADTNHRWMSSAAMDKKGNILLGYSRSGPATFPSVYYTGRLSTAPINTLQPEGLIRTGTGAQVGHSRWGDYSAMTVDPVNDCTFWYTQEYIDAPNGDFIWKTRIANAKFPNCI